MAWKSANAVRIAGIATVAAGLSACIIDAPRGGGDPRFGGGPVQTRIEGNWSPQDGGAVATFQNGAFTNRAVDTGQSFTSGGRYSYTGPNQVAISYTSVVRQEQVNVNCLVVSAGQMNCTTATGARFALFRRA